MVFGEKLRSCCTIASLALAGLLSGCQGLPSSAINAPRTGDINSINHIIFMAQENRSFDRYFGQLPAYWQANAYPQASAQFDGLLPNASNPAYNGTAIPGPRRVCVKNALVGAWCCAGDEGRPFEAGLQKQASNSHELLRSKAAVVNVMVKSSNRGSPGSLVPETCRET